MMPHLAEEVFAALNPGTEALVAEMLWPAADPELLRAESVTLAVQVMGKLRATIEVPVGARTRRYSPWRRPRRTCSVRSAASR